MTNFDFGFGAAAFGRDGDVDVEPRTSSTIHDGGGVVFCVFARAGGIGLERGAELVVGVKVGATHAFVRHLLNVERGRAAVRAFKAHIHTDLDEDVDDAGVLADGAMAFGAHAAVDEDLGNGVFGGVGLLALVGFGEAGDVVHRVVVADVLERAGYAGDEIFLAD